MTRLETDIASAWKQAVEVLAAQTTHTDEIAAVIQVLKNCERRSYQADEPFRATELARMIFHLKGRVSASHYPRYPEDDTARVVAAPATGQDVPQGGP